MVHHTMNSSSASAASISRMTTHMVRALRERCAPSTGRSRHLLAGILGITAGCAMPADPVTAPSSATAAVVPAVAKTREPTPITRARSRWVPVSWSELPGWSDDRTRELWPALLAGCARPVDGWAGVCKLANALQPADDAQARDFLQRTLQPYRVETPGGDTTGLATGYFEPYLSASRVPRGAMRVALWRPPADLATRRPWWTREQLDTLPAARASVRGNEIAYVADPLDALLVQVQGSGRLRITEPDGRERLLRLAYAGHNDHTYKSVGRWLVEQGELRVDEASWQTIRDWARRYPGRLNEMLWSNPRVVFFREEPLPDESIGPRGAQGAPLTPGRSVAVDPLSVPYGSVLWLDTTEPLTQRPLRRAVMAQDTGSAITGAVRIDYFWGWGGQAELQAGRMKQPVRVWALWPRP
jgi:membrane-bound lytic murein transglycosylase A